MKDLMLINNGLHNNFWVKAIDTANYLQNKLPTKSKNYGEMISEKAWIGRRQDFNHVRIFDSLVLANISLEKRSKFDYQKI